MITCIGLWGGRRSRQKHIVVFTYRVLVRNTQYTYYRINFSLVLKVEMDGASTTCAGRLFQGFITLMVTKVSDMGLIGAVGSSNLEASMQRNIKTSGLIKEHILCIHYWKSSRLWIIKMATNI